MVGFYGLVGAGRTETMEVISGIRMADKKEFVFDGEESTMNDLANRVLVAKMTFDKMLLNIKSIDYYAADPDKKSADARIPLLSFNSNIDFNNNKTFVKDFELILPKPMPSGFINMLTKQKTFQKRDIYRQNEGYKYRQISCLTR